MSSLRPMMLGLHKYVRLQWRERLLRGHQLYAVRPSKCFSGVDFVRGVTTIIEGAGTETDDSGQYETLKVYFDNGIRTIIFNRPDKKNALSEKMFEEIPQALAVAAQDPHTVITATTGAGNVYCAGNDKNNFTSITMPHIKDILTSFFAAYIDFPKPLVAMVNGAAVGGGATTLALYDAVYASEKAVFFTPFSALDVTVEGCSSYTFPQLMGQAKASELLYFNKKIGAKEAEKLGLVTEVLPAATFFQDLKPKLLAMAELPLKSLMYTKQLSRDPVRDILHKVNIEECKRITERIATLQPGRSQEIDEYIKQNW